MQSTQIEIPAPAKLPNFDGKEQSLPVRLRVCKDKGGAAFNTKREANAAVENVQERHPKIFKYDRKYIVHLDTQEAEEELADAMSTYTILYRAYVEVTYANVCSTFSEPMWFNIDLKPYEKVLETAGRPMAQLALEYQKEREARFEKTKMPLMTYTFNRQTFEIPSFGMVSLMHVRDLKGGTESQDWADPLLRADGTRIFGAAGWMHKLQGSRVIVPLESQLVIDISQHSDAYKLREPIAVKQKEVQVTVAAAYVMERRLAEELHLGAELAPEY